MHCYQLPSFETEVNGNKDQDPTELRLESTTSELAVGPTELWGQYEKVEESVW